MADAWYIDKALVDYITAPNEKGSIATIHPDTHNLKWSSDDGEDSSSMDTYPNGFTLEFDYTFDTSRGDVGQGYVQIDKPGPPKKLSFVGNSGVKFGSSDPSERKEVAILDVSSMVALAGGLNSFSHDPQTGFGILDDDANDPDPKHKGRVNIDGYTTEPLNRLMTGVLYGGDYESMDVDWGDAQASPGIWQEYYGVLLANLGHTNRHITIDLTRLDANGLAYELNVYLDNSVTPTYRDTALVLAEPVDVFWLQSHWGSGVIFSEMQVSKK